MRSMLMLVLLVVVVVVVVQGAKPKFVERKRYGVLGITLGIPLGHG